MELESWDKLNAGYFILGNFPGEKEQYYNIGHIINFPEGIKTNYLDVKKPQLV